MLPIDPAWLDAVLTEGGSIAVIALLLIGTVSFLKEWVVPGSALRQARQETAEWKKVAEEASQGMQFFVPVLEQMGESLKDMSESLEYLRKVEEIDREVARVLDARDGED